MMSRCLKGLWLAMAFGLAACAGMLSRLPIGVVNLLRGQAPPQGTSLRVATAKFSAVIVLALAVIALMAWRAARARRAWGGVATALAAMALVGATLAAALAPSLLWAFAPELALALGAAVSMLGGPLVWRVVVHRGGA